MMWSEAIEGVGKMVAAMPHGRPPDEKGYVGALAAALMNFPRSVALACVAVPNGLVKSLKYLPTVADIEAWCAREVKWMHEQVDREDQAKRQLAERKRLDEEHEQLAEDRKTRPNLDVLKAKYGPNWGLGGLDAEQKQADDRAAAKATRERANASLLAAEYARAGVEPVVASDGTPVSLELARKLGKR